MKIKSDRKKQNKTKKNKKQNKKNKKQNKKTKNKTKKLLPRKLMVNLFWFTMLSKTILPIAFLPLTLLVLLSLVFWLFAYLHCLSKQKAQFSKTWFLKIAWPRSNFCHALDFQAHIYITVLNFMSVCTSIGIDTSHHVTT